VVPYNVSFSAGMHGSFAARKMAGPTATMLNYNLYSDPGMTMVLGDGSGGTQVVSSSIQVAILNLLVPQVQNVYAQIPANQNVPHGCYSDTVTMTLQF
jgi:spore coat protein U-like protein